MLTPSAFLAVALLRFAPPAQPSPDSAAFARLAQEFVLRALSFSPITATQNGLHRFVDPATGRTILLDERLDDVSPAAERRQLAYYRGLAARLDRLHPERLDPQTLADLDLLRSGVRYALYALTRERAPHARPQVYAEALGNALFAPISLEYADTASRARHLAARLERVPGYLAQAARNLERSNAMHRRVALEELAGVADLIRKTGTDFVRGTSSEAQYGRATAPALAALDRYATFVRDRLPRRPQADWRMGEARFAAKWRDVLQVSRSPAEMFARATARLAEDRAEMLRLAGPLHAQWFPAHRHGADSLNPVVSEVLARIGEEHANQDSLLVQAQHDVAALEDVVRRRRLLSLDDFSNLRVIPTPVFMRGVYGVAGAVFAPALEPKLTTFYWVTPIPPEWPAERAEAKLREYNRYKMLTLTSHEAVPGHTTQGTYANMVTPAWRRVLRSFAGNGPYVEGWGVYSEHLMRAAGVDGGDSVKARLTELKGMLRLEANSIIDIGLHTRGMSEEEAVRLMVEDAFQERPEAEAKLQRAQLDYVQLNMYLAGIEDWEALRHEAEQAEGADFNACRFHDRVLLYGALPVPTVRKLYFAGVAPSASGPADRCGSAGT